MGILSERRTLAPYGMAGGLPGARGLNLLIRGEDSVIVNIGGKASIHVQAVSSLNGRVYSWPHFLLCCFFLSLSLSLSLSSPISG